MSKTSNDRRIAAYPPPRLYEIFKQYAKGTGLSESKALIAILSSYFEVPLNEGEVIDPPFVTHEQLDKKLEEIKSLIVFSEEPPV